MINKKKLLFLCFILIIISQTFLYTNNNQNTSFKFFKWTVKEISIGKLMSISFFSGLIISSFLNTTITSFKKNNSENNEEYYEPLSNDEEMKSNIEMPPQRDVRDTQPTISVNYRVIKNTEENNLKSDQNFSNKTVNKDDWDDNNSEW